MASFVKCLVCNGVGELDNTNRLPKARQVRLCENCRGIGGVIEEETCRGCGRGCLEEYPVAYCGRETCWEKLVEVVDPEKEEKIVRMVPRVDLRGFVRTGYERHGRHPGMPEAELRYWARNEYGDYCC